MTAPLLIPLLVLNLGSEMVFVLDQQLRAKKTPSERRLRELRALLRALHDRPFISALFQPTPTLPTALATRALFGRLANAPPSLTVNARAMNTLYNAICAGFQRQLLASTNTLLDTTLNHLDSTKTVVGKDEFENRDDVEETLVNETILRTHETYRELSTNDERLLRQQLCDYLQDPSISEMSVKSLDRRGDRPDRSPYYSTLKGRSALESDDEETKMIEEIISDARRGLRTLTLDDDKEVNVYPREFKATANDAVELLAELLGSSTSKSTPDSDASTWKWTLFDDTNETNDEKVDTLWIDARSEPKAIDVLRDEWENVGDAKRTTKHVEEDDDDLLHLMDTTASK